MTLASSCRGAALITVFWFLASGISCGRNPFPTEEEVRQQLRPGMTKQQVIDAFGHPGGSTESSATYYAGVGLLQREEPGYAGFVVHFRDGVVRDWETITNNPSYDPATLGPPLAFKLWLLSWPAMFVVAFLVGLFGAAKFLFAERRRLLRAFLGMKLSPNLPPDFAFITHDTTVGEVLERAGPCSRWVNFPTSASEVQNYPLIQTNTGRFAIRMLEYDLPYLGVVIVLPEYPFDDKSLIRAVYVRRSRTREISMQG